MIDVDERHDSGCLYGFVGSHEAHGSSCQPHTTSAPTPRAGVVYLAVKAAILLRSLCESGIARVGVNMMQTHGHAELER